MEAKQCPDGSYVGRTGPNCEFALCPSEASCEGGTCPSPQIIGGDKDEHGCLIAAGYSWCEEKQKCLRAWEESCADTADWQIYQNDQYGFEIKYPAKYKAAQDTYGWSHSLVLFLSPSGQSYIIQVEVWDTPDAFKNIYKTDPPFTVKTEDNKYITINHAGFEEKSIPEWSGMVASFRFIR